MTKFTIELEWTLPQLKAKYETHLGKEKEKVQKKDLNLWFEGFLSAILEDIPPEE